MGKESVTRGVVAVVPVRDDPGASPSAMLAGSALGLLSGLLIHAELVRFVWEGRRPSGAVAAACLVGAWAASTWILSWKVKRVARVIRRGCLLGSAEWLFASLGDSSTSVLAWSGVADASTSDRVSLVMGGWLGPLLDGTAPVVMSLCCLLGFLFCSTLLDGSLSDAEAWARTSPLADASRVRDQLDAQK